MFADRLTDGCLVSSTDLVDLFAALEELEGRHGLNTSLLCSFTILVDIYFHEDHIREFLSHRLQLGRNHLAGRAPRREEVDDQ